jgi:predicted adenylyl cyclase CyaB
VVDEPADALSIRYARRRMEADPTTGAPRRNIELKSKCPDLARAGEAALRLGAREAGVLEQIDTYFHCTSGRLKLRETAGHPAELIAYARPDEPDVRASAYHLVPVAEPGPLKRALAGALGVRVVVVKRRRLLLWHNVRIHLDEVAGLGSFVEFEAVMGEGEDDATAYARVATLGDALELQPGDRISTSYGELMSDAASAPRPASSLGGNA